MSIYILPVGIMLGIGFISAVVLSVASKVMEVPTDPRADQIREALPGANCGACGFAGCDAYAKALADGSCETLSLCAPGGAAAAAAIGEILGKNAGTFEAKRAFVHCQGSCDNTGDKMEYRGEPTCAACKTFYSGKGLCNFGCLGFGDCVAACKYDAISVHNGVARVRPGSCVGCQMCAKACPSGIIEMVPASAKVMVACSSLAKGADTRKACKVGCIGCKKCEKTCPNDAIHVVDNRAVIDYSKCTGCGACVEGCPTGAIIRG